MATMRSITIRIAGNFIAAINPQCRFDRTIFVLGHMRSGSSALSQVLCHHPDVSGHGEAHVYYNHRAALGVLTLKQIYRRAWDWRARHLFDKVLHTRYHKVAGPAFFSARAIFLVRPPRETILSIRKLFGTLNHSDLPDDAAAADYYEDRLHQLARLWERFPADRRIGLTFASLTADPDSALDRISALIGLTPPLANRYERFGKVLPLGDGDALSVHKFSEIVPASVATTLKDVQRELDLPAGRLDALEQLYASVCALFA